MLSNSLRCLITLGMCRGISEFYNPDYWIYDVVVATRSLVYGHNSFVRLFGSFINRMVEWGGRIQTMNIWRKERSTDRVKNWQYENNCAFSIGICEFNDERKTTHWNNNNKINNRLVIDPAGKTLRYYVVVNDNKKRIFQTKEKKPNIKMYAMASELFNM